MDPILDPVAFDVQEVEIRLRHAGHRVTRVDAAWIGIPDGAPDDLHAGLIRRLADSDFDALHDAVPDAPERSPLPVPALPAVTRSGAAGLTVAVERWPAQTVAQTSRLLWLGGLGPGRGLDVALTAARLVDRPMLIAGPMLDADWFATVIRSRMGAHAWYLGSLTRRDTADLLCCCAALVHTDTRPSHARPGVCMSVASGTPVAAVRTADLARWFRPAFGQLTGTAAPGVLADAILAVSRYDRARCVDAARALFAPTDFA